MQQEFPSQIEDFINSLNAGTVVELNLWGDVHIYKNDSALFLSVWKAINFEEWEADSQALSSYELIYLKFTYEDENTITFTIYDNGYGLYNDSPYIIPKETYSNVLEILNAKFEERTYDLTNLDSMFEADYLLFATSEESFYISREFTSGFQDILEMDKWVMDLNAVDDSPVMQIRVSDGNNDFIILPESSAILIIRGYDYYTFLVPRETMQNIIDAYEIYRSHGQEYPY